MSDKVKTICVIIGISLAVICLIASRITDDADFIKAFIALLFFTVLTPMIKTA